MCCDSHAAANAYGREHPYAGSALEGLAESPCGTYKTNRGLRAKCLGWATLHPTGLQDTFIIILNRIVSVKILSSLPPHSRRPSSVRQYFAHIQM